ncbi:MAG: hypothetical protein RIM99_06080 [Cyclobacteriaceae bacterium]
MPESKKINWTNHLIELLIVIIGISVAFWLNNLATESREKELEASFIFDLKTDLRKDSIRLETIISQNEAKIETLMKGLNLIQSDSRHQYSDSLWDDHLSQIGNYNFFSPDNLTLMSLLQSGDIKMIRSNDLKKELLRLLRIYDDIESRQANFLQALDDNYFPMILGKRDMISGEVLDPDFFYSIRIKNYAAFTLNDTSQHIQQYKYALKQIVKLLDLMNEYKIED